MTNTTDNTQTENTQTENTTNIIQTKPKRVHAPKHISKKSIIRQMLLEELHSPKMQKRLADVRSVFIDYDKHFGSKGDDGLIEFAWFIRKFRTTIVDSSATMFALTTRAYLLVHAYKKSAIKISKKGQQYDAIVKEALDKLAWYKRLSDEAKGLYREVLAAHEKANSKNNK